MLTDQQAQAVHTRDASVVLSSGAGCGKTRVLTARYLAHLRDDGAGVHQLAAITFTDKAAREMRDRIRGELRRALRAAATDADAERWARHVRDLETAAICTIHAFCGTLLRQNAFAAGLDPRFEVLEDALSFNVRDDALREGLQQLLTEASPAGEDLRELIVLYGWQTVKEAVGALLDVPDQVGWEDWAARPAEEIAIDYQLSVRRELLPDYVRFLSTGAPKIASCLHLLRTTPCAGPKMRVCVERLLQETPRLHQAVDLASAVEELIEAAKVGPERAKAWPDESTYAAIKEAFEQFRGDLPKRLELFTTEPEGLEEAVAVGQRFLRVTRECTRLYRQQKQRAAVLDFNDLLVLARNLLRDSRHVRDELRRRYRFVLIDELQDTDRVQMELVELLCGPGLSQGTLFAVGDAKQSIYRFRGAEVELFRGLRQRIPATGRQELSLNFRSQPGLLHFTNALLGRHLADYEPLRASRPQVNRAPCVEFLWSQRGEKDNAAEARGREADHIARRIAEMVGQGQQIVAEHHDGRRCLRPVRAGDIVLLFRAMSQVAIYEAALRDRGLDYYIVGGRAFFAQQEVYDLLNLLRALENPQDAVSLAGTLRSPFAGLSDEALYWLSRHPDGLWAGLHDASAWRHIREEERAAVERASRWLGRWRAHKDRLPIAGLLKLAVADSGYDAALQFGILGERRLANLWKLIDLARTFDGSGLFGLADFVHRLGELVKAQPREEQAATQQETADVVRLMSIHQAKGLEFPVVILPDLAATAGGPHLPVAQWDARLGCVVRPPAEEEPRLFSDFGWKLWQAQEAVADWQEDLRTLYVACTRPQDYLILSAALPEPVTATNATMATLLERFDLATGRCLDESIPDEEQPCVRVSPPTRPDGDERRVSRRPEARPPLGTVDAAAIAPVPIRLSPRSLLAVSALRHLRLVPLRASLFSDAEESGPVLDWSDTVADAPAERVFRQVMARWDLREPDGWQSLLGSALAAEPGPSDSLAEVKRWFRVLAKSTLAPRLTAAVETHHDVAMVFDAGTSHHSGVMIRGRIDLAWREGPDDWHVLHWHFGPEGAEAAFEARHGEILLACETIRRQFGVWPSTAAVCSLRTGRIASSIPDRKQIDHVLTRLRDLMVSGQPAVVSQP